MKTSKRLSPPLSNSNSDSGNQNRIESMPVFKRYLILILFLSIAPFISFTANAGSIKAMFSYTWTGGCNPPKVTFKDSSQITGSDKIVKWYWSFGDFVRDTATTSSSNIIHTYSFMGAGAYPVTLVTTDQNGVTDTDIQTVYVGSIRANMAVSKICLGHPTYFTDVSYSHDHPITSWHWEFGDGSTSTLQNPVHTYTKQGNFFTYLTVDNGYCIDSQQSEASPGIPLQPKIYCQSTACLSDSIFIQGNDSSNDSTMRYWWSIDNIYKSSSKSIWYKPQTAGYHTITFMLVKGSTYSCIDSAQKTIFIDSSCVWPGDADDNKIVNMNDLLAIGIAYGDTGYARPNASLTWNAQPCQDWPRKFKSGVNYKEADCDGNNIVD